MKKIIFFIKIVLSIIILVIIFSKIDLSQFLITIREVTFFTIIGIAFVGSLKIILQIINWKMYLQINKNYEQNIKEIISSLFIGHSLRFLVPGGHGVIGKMYFVKNKKKASFLSIGIEKFFQMWINFLFATIAFTIFYRPIQNIFLRIFIIAFVSLLPGLFLVLSIFLKKDTHIDYLKQYKFYLIPIIFNLIIHHFLTFIQYYLILNSFIKINFLISAVSSSLILAANLIPITYSGLGLRETFGIEVLSKYGISSEIAVTSTLLTFMINSIIPALIGVYFIIKYRRNKNA